MITSISESAAGKYFGSTYPVASGLKPVAFPIIVDPDFFEKEGEDRYRYVTDNVRGAAIGGAEDRLR